MLAKRTSLFGLLCLVLMASAAMRFYPAPQDDAYISFRYARNLAAGEGLVFNPGERVEGFSNPAWTLLIAGALALGASPERFAALVGAASWAGIAALVGLAARRRGPLPGMAAALLLSASPFLGIEAVQGLETELFVFLVLAVLLLEAPWARAACGSLLVLSRPEGVGLFVLIEGLRWASGERRLAAARAVPLLVFAAYLAFRVGYYGELLPNTFYAKVGATSSQVLRGLGYLGEFARSHAGLLAGALLGAAALWRGGERRRLVQAAAVGGLWALYVAVVGGDFKETLRFCHLLIALAALLAGAALAAEQRGLRALGWAAAAAALAQSAAHVEPLTRYARGRLAVYEEWRLVGELLEARLPPGSVVALPNAGIVPYFAPSLHFLDMLGLTEKEIARAEKPPGFGSGLAGHESQDMAFVFGGHEPPPDVYYASYLTKEPEAPMVPEGVPADFYERYEPVSVPTARGWLNVWRRVEIEPSVSGEDGGRHGDGG